MRSADMPIASGTSSGRKTLGMSCPGCLAAAGAGAGASVDEADGVVSIGGGKDGGSAGVGAWVSCRSACPGAAGTGPFPKGTGSMAASWHACWGCKLLSVSFGISCVLAAEASWGMFEGAATVGCEASGGKVGTSNGVSAQHSCAFAQLHFEQSSGWSKL